MKKFLAVLLAVAVLGVAGAAFAAGHEVTPPTSDSTKQVHVNETKLVEIATKYVTSTDVTASGLDVVEKSVTTASVDKAVESHAAKQEAVVAVLPTLKNTTGSIVPTATATVKFDAIYNGKTPLAEVTSKDVATSGTDAAFSAKFSEVKEGKATLTLANVPAKKALDIVAYLTSADVAGISAYSDAFVSGDKKTVGALSTYIPDEIWVKINEKISVDKVLTGDNLGDQITTTKSTDVSLGLAKLKGLTKESVYAFQVVSFDKLANVTSVDKTSLALVLDGSAYVAATKATRFFNDEGTDVTGTNIPSKTGYVAFQATDTTATPVLTVKKTSSGGGGEGSKEQWSNKGSGGCNGGFAGLAVLALGALALRKKAR